MFVLFLLLLIIIIILLGKKKKRKRKKIFYIYLYLLYIKDKIKQHKGTFLSFGANIQLHFYIAKLVPLGKLELSYANPTIIKAAKQRMWSTDNEHNCFILLSSFSLIFFFFSPCNSWPNRIVSSRRMQTITGNEEILYLHWLF